MAFFVLKRSGTLALCNSDQQQPISKVMPEAATVIVAGNVQYVPYGPVCEWVATYWFGRAVKLFNGQ